MPPETQLQSLKKSLAGRDYCTYLKPSSQLRLEKSVKYVFSGLFVLGLPLDGIFHPTYTRVLPYVEGVPTVQGMDRRDSLRFLDLRNPIDESTPARPENQRA